MRNRLREFLITAPTQKRFGKEDIMKKVLASILLAVVLTLCGCGAENGKDGPAFFLQIIRSSTFDESDASASQAQEDTELAIFTVTKEYIGSTTQESLDSICEEQGYRSVILNSDGSVTYKMSARQQKKLLDACTEQIGKEFHQMVEADRYPNFTGLYGNENFTEFIVNTDSEKVSSAELSVLEDFRMYSDVYSMLSGVGKQAITVSFINNDTGETIYEETSEG